MTKTVICEPQNSGETETFAAKRLTDVRLKVRTNNRVKVPIGQKHWSVRS